MYNKFQPKKTGYSFRDLEVYQKSMECSVLILKNFKPALTKLKYPYLENMINTCLSIPLYVGESHGQRFSDFNLGIATLEKAMTGCNKMVIFLEQAKGLYGIKINNDLAEDLIRRYIECRTKMFRLGNSWKKYRKEYSGNEEGKKFTSF